MFQSAQQVEYSEEEEEEVQEVFPPASAQRNNNSSNSSSNRRSEGGGTQSQVGRELLKIGNPEYGATAQIQALHFLTHRFDKGGMTELC